MPRHWFIKTKSGKAGPITSKKLVRLASQGKIQPNSGVSPDGQSWLKAKSVVGLTFPESQSKRWFVRTKGGDAGPFTLAKLHKLALDGRVRPDVAVSCDGKRWVQAKQAPGIRFPEIGERSDQSDDSNDQQTPGEAQAGSATTPRPREKTPDAPSRRRVGRRSEEKKGDKSAKAGKSSVSSRRRKKQTAAQQAASRWGQRREAEYLRRFGPVSEVVREGGSAAIDIYVHPASDQRPFTTLVTSGMSNQAMPVPQGPNSPRAELIVYVDRPHPTYVNMLRYVAHFPYQRHTHLAYGSLINNGQPAKPICRNSVLDCYVLMIPNVPSDFQIQDAISIDGNPLQLLWVVPITTAERQFIASHGMRQFCGLLDQNRHSMLLDPTRQCYVTGRTAV